MDDTSAEREIASGEVRYPQNTWSCLLESLDPFRNPNLLFAWENFEIPSLPRRERPWLSVFEEIFNLKQSFTPAHDFSKWTTALKEMNPR
jgi:hypothetical protein